MKTLFLFFFVLLISAVSVIAAGEGTYGNETYGNFSYGISSASSSSFSNSSVTTTANTTTVINATAGASAPNAALEIVTNSDTSGAVTLVKYNSQPPTVSTNTFASPLNRYIDVVVANSIGSQLNYSIIKMFYTDAEVSAANLQESTMRLSRWNGSTWVQFNPPSGNVDTINNFVWANTSSFSTWGIFGTAVPAPEPAPSAAVTAGGGGGVAYGWQCTDWSECSSAGVQTRTCSLVPGGGAITKPEETRACTYVVQQPEEEIAPETEEAAEPTVAEAPAPEPAAAAPAAPTGLAAITGNAISALKTPLGTIGAVVVVILVGIALYAGYYQIYKKP